MNVIDRAFQLAFGWSCGLVLGAGLASFVIVFVYAMFGWFDRK